jgi:hypothetical protein
VNEAIVVKALTTADTVREDPTLVMVANAIGIVTDLAKTIRSEVKDETLSTHHVFCTATGSASYVDKNAVQTELENSSLVTMPISDRRKNGSKGSIAKTDFNVHGVNDTRVTPTDARVMYTYCQQGFRKVAAFLKTGCQYGRSSRMHGSEIHQV